MPYVQVKARYGTWYRSDEPASAKYNKTSYLALRASGPTMHSYVYFSNPFNFPRAKVLEAKLYFYMQHGTTNPGTRTLSVQRVANGLNFTQMNYNNRPTQFTGSTYNKSTTGPLSAQHQFEIDVTADLQAVANGASFYGYIITTTAPFVIQLHGAMTTYPPTLFVRYAYPPTPPQDLSPAQGRAVGITKPFLGFSYYDTAGEEKITGLRVQTSATSGGFGSPAWDSGQLAASTPGLDLSTTSFPARTANQTTWWRVQVRSSAGEWSPWSTPTPFKYVPHQTVTITNPTGTTFSDPTPPITWTSTGTQARWAASLRVLRDGVVAETVDHSGVRTGAAGTWTPAKGAVKVGLAHRIAVDVYDSVDREATPGDRLYASDHVDTIFTPSGTVATQTGLTVESNYPRPEVTLKWNRTELPDRWRIYRDADLVADLPGTATRVGSTTAHTYTTRSGAGEHVWAVRAMVNGKVSNTGGTVTHRTDVLGTWLFDDEGRSVCVQDDREHDAAYAEVSVVHEPLGSGRVVVVTQALRGYEGTLSGLLVPLKGQAETPDEWRRNLLLWKSQPGIELTMVYEGDVFPVVLRKINVKGAPLRRGHAAEFEFYQQSGTPFSTTMGG